MAKIIMFGMIALIGIASFIVAVIFLTLGATAELFTLLLAPVSGICLAIVMHLCDIALTVSFSLKQGNFSFSITQT
jgi:membrane-bound ClpP family serine protease